MLDFHSVFRHGRACPGHPRGSASMLPGCLGDAQKLMTRGDEGDVLRAFLLPCALPVIASVAKQSISPRDGPPTSFQNRLCNKRFKDLVRERTRRGANRRAGGSGTVDCFASLAMTG